MRQAVESQDVLQTVGPLTVAATLEPSSTSVYPFLNETRRNSRDQPWDQRTSHSRYQSGDDSGSNLFQRSLLRVAYLCKNERK